MRGEKASAKKRLFYVQERKTDLEAKLDKTLFTKKGNASGKGHFTQRVRVPFFTLKVTEPQGRRDNGRMQRDGTNTSDRRSFLRKWPQLLEW